MSEGAPPEDPVEFPPGFFARQDEGDDAAFYATPRLVTHIDDATIAALAAAYQEWLVPGAAVLDLMSSWVSHLPPAEALPLGRVAVHGMNEAELRANPRATEWHVQDLNRTPSLPYEPESFDAALCAVSIQYLTRPVEVFAELARVLRPGGFAAIAMSHRCFPTKAIRAFHVLPPKERVAVVATYFARAGGFEPAVFHDRSPQGADPLWVVKAERLAVTDTQVG